ncbi:MAG: hypothetical protein A2521_05035 [Deltaproteobacteria bacterium RIFOXYD12_FULL_57_12]|nr:MAG: hypothetical protein A2521_05035 [Deltaproteobacteria bacterium RIFOXYD12_FULL_57_12]
MKKWNAATRLQISVVIVFLLTGIGMIAVVNRSMRQFALHAAEEQAELLLSHNLAIHTYFNQQLKPKVFKLTDSVAPNGYFEPTWMSSTFAVREIDKLLTKTPPAENHFLKDCIVSHHYYKECAINARSPENEADTYEKAFLAALNRDSSLTSRSAIREINGQPFFTVLRRGETLEKNCLRCHDTPDQAPQGLVNVYGPVRSFNRNVKDVVSAVSIRIPLSAAYEQAKRISLTLSGFLIGLLAFVSLLIFWLNHCLVASPLARLKNKALQIANGSQQIGEQIPIPSGRELAELSEAFNTMSLKLRQHLDTLEKKVEARTVELTKTNQELHKSLSEIKTLSGLLPICASCKKIRDDQGYWQQIEKYIHQRTSAQFSHGICPECARNLYPEYFDKNK